MSRVFLNNIFSTEQIKESSVMAYYEDVILEQNGRTKCVLCKVLIPDNNSAMENHILDKEHITLFMKRLMIRNNITNIDNKIICVICSKETDSANILDHLNSRCHLNHMEMIKSIIEKDGGFLALPEKITNHGSNVYCVICDCCVSFRFDTIKDHLISQKHRRARSIAVQPLNGIFSVEGNSDDLWCKICQIYFENYMETIFEHVDDDPEHAKKLKKILNLIDGENINIEKFLYDPKEDKGMCTKCGIEVPCNVDNLSTHINGKKHKSS